MGRIKKIAAYTYYQIYLTKVSEETHKHLVLLPECETFFRKNSI